jgi:hypothetical protein
MIRIIDAETTRSSQPARASCESPGAATEHQRTDLQRD